MFFIHIVIPSFLLYDNHISRNIISWSAWLLLPGNREKVLTLNVTLHTKQWCIICKQLIKQGGYQTESYGRLITSHKNTTALVQRFGRIEVHSSFGCLLAAWLVSFCQILWAKFKCASELAVSKAPCLVGRKQPASEGQWKWLRPAFKLYGEDGMGFTEWWRLFLPRGNISIPDIDFVPLPLNRGPTIVP